MPSVRLLSRIRMPFWLFIFLASFFSTTVQSSQTLTNRQAAVAMPDVYSAEVAEQVLLQGGNAIDASVAAAFVLAVTYPEAGNLGGGGFMTLYTASQNHPENKQAYFLDYRETAPKAAHRDLYLDQDKQVIPYRSLVGYQASGVPGTVMGLWQAHQRFGSFPWKQLLQPAIGYAQHGFTVSEHLARNVQWFEQWIAGKSPEPLNFSDFFGKLKAGQRFKQPRLAETLMRIAEQGPLDFYHGKTAKLLVAEMQKHDGLITLEDLAGYEAKWREPIHVQWQGREVVSAPPPSSGGIAIAQLLKMKQLLRPKLDQALQQAKKEGVPLQAVKTHVYAELEKRVYADRAHYLGDPDFVEVPVSRLIAEDYLAQRVQGVMLDAISESETIKPGKIESPETTHFSIIDADGNAVSNTYTLNMPFGSGVVIPQAGFLMNDEMDDFSTKPGVANIFGVVGGKANEIAPHKRMLSSMSPTIVLKNGQVEMVVGTPGGSTIITSVFQALVNVVDEGMSAQQAVDAARVHHQLLPKDQIAYHPDLPEEVKEELSVMGYTLKRNNYMGDIQLIVKQRHVLEAAADYRGRGEARVFQIR
ncbi:gamma-glutamyltransferase [Thiomicrorhabdus sp. zzn3]|uniref:gamma-glutamyltransferase n=1 Tax=Thiomicrorhabdus sp. zzn3 TaxID=3039775 RepID=UPI002436B200|nr:gamma-glutamyltransferase [Thiomicrorhabdus sp. zzn3]MDG6778537.1 gamma-glutamyltransferase [Thiomicrorhabdus sp. zzn3]